LLDVKGPIKGAPGWALGDVVPEGLLKSVPPALADKIPKLRGARYVVNNGVAVLTGAGNRVVAIVNPA
jgi:hypothetical protein